MKTNIFIIILIALSLSAYSQNTYFTKTGTVDFFSSTPIEDIKAVNNNVVSFIKTETGEISFGVLIKSFKFENSLMQEHFNENYMESDKYPKAKFKGNIENFEEVDFKKDGTYPINVTGKITIHGITREINSKANLTVKGDNISATSFMQVKPEDYYIEIPAIVRDKIGKIIDVNIKADYVPYEK